MRIKTGDRVQVIAGKDKGQIGEVIRVDRRRDRVVVRGVNMVKRHKRPSPVDPEGGIIEREGTIHASNVLLYSEKLERGVRVAYRFKGASGDHHATRQAALATFSEPPARVEKVRVCVKTGEEFR